MTWWHWVLLGIALLVVEISIPGYLFALFFGAAAICVAPVAALGASATAQWFAFSILAALGLLVLRGPLLRRFTRGPSRPPPLVGERAVLLEELKPGGQAQAELRGTVWTARTRASQPLAVGQRCIVEGEQDLILWVRPEPHGLDEAKGEDRG